VEVNEVLNGDIGAEVQKLTLNYIGIRNQCLNFKNLYRKLGKEELLANPLDWPNLPSIGRDLEERNRELTLEKLKE
jgi:hypothetical protein